MAEAILLRVAFLLTEGAWTAAALAVWAAWLDRRPDHPALLTMPVVLLTLGISFLAGAWLLRPAAGDGADAGDEPRRRAAAVTLGLTWSLPAVWLSRHLGDGPEWLGTLPDAVASVLHGPTPDLAAVLAAAWLWWRGQRAGATPPDFPAVVRTFGIGALALTASLIPAALGLGGGTTLLISPPLFLCAGLAALSLSRLQEVRWELEVGALHGGSERLGGAWLRAAGPPVVVVLIGALAAAALLGDEASRAAILGLLSTAGQALWNVLYYPLVLVGFVAEWLILLLRGLMPAATSQRPPQPQAPNPIDQLRRLAADGPQALPAWLPYARWGAIVLGALLLLLLFVSAARIGHREWSREAATGAERESLWSWRATWQAFRSWLVSLPRRWLGGARALGRGLTSIGGMHAAASDEAGRDVRALYRQFLVLGRAHGFARPAHRTPHEYLMTWEEQLPDSAEAGELTEAYVAARYAAAPPASEAELARLQRSLARLDGQLRERDAREAELTGPR